MHQFWGWVIHHCYIDVRNSACVAEQLTTEEYTVESYHLYSHEYLPLHIVTSTWILTLAKLLYIVPFTFTHAKHIPIWSHIFQCQRAVGCYIIFQITIGGREILIRVNTMLDCSGSGSSAWMSLTLCTMILCDSKHLLSIVSRSHYHDETCTNMSVQWLK